VLSGIALCGILVVEAGNPRRLIMAAKRKPAKARTESSGRTSRDSRSLPSAEWLASKLLQMDCEPDQSEWEGTGRSYRQARDARRLENAEHILGVYACAQTAIEIASGKKLNPHSLLNTFTKTQIERGLSFDEYAKYVASDSNCMRAKRKLAVWIDSLEPPAFFWELRMRNSYYDNATGFITGNEWVLLHDNGRFRQRTDTVVMHQRSFAAFDKRRREPWAALLGEKKS
jgi:hypothetical protein